MEYERHDSVPVPPTPLPIAIVETCAATNPIARSAAQPFTYAYTYLSRSAARHSGEVERGEWKSGFPEWLRQKKRR